MALEYPVEQAITDHIAGFLLRYFTRAEKAQIERPYVDAARDRDLLRLHWAMSPVVQELVRYVLQHRNEIQSTLKTALRIEDSVIRGRIDARATVIHRRMAGLSTAMVSQEPLRSYDSGPNHVLSWVLKQAWSLASRFAAMVPPSASYRTIVDTAIQSLEQVRRIHAIALMADQPTAIKRPGSGAILEARRSRREVYRKACAAYEYLLRIESADAEAITAMLRATLLAPLEPWRRYELAVAFSLAEALEADGDTAMALNLLIGETSAPIVRVGRHSIFWQSRTKYSLPPVWEPSEVVSLHILNTYGFSASVDRPDLVVTDDEAGLVASVVEVKYLTAEDASDRVRGAVSQLVRYARLYHPIDETSPLLGRSLIAVSQGLEGIPTPSPLPYDVPLLIDFATIKSDGLATWASRLKH